MLWLFLLLRSRVVPSQANPSQAKIKPPVNKSDSDSTFLLFQPLLLTHFAFIYCALTPLSNSALFVRRTLLHGKRNPPLSLSHNKTQCKQKVFPPSHFFFKPTLLPQCNQRVCLRLASPLSPHTTLSSLATPQLLTRRLESQLG